MTWEICRSGHGPRLHIPGLAGCVLQYVESPSPGTPAGGEVLCSAWPCAGTVSASRCAACCRIGRGRRAGWPTVPIGDLQATLPVAANAALIELAAGANHEQVAEQLQAPFPDLHVEASGRRAVYEEARAQKTRAQVILQRYTWLLFARFGLLVWTLTGVDSRGRRPEWSYLLATGVEPRVILLAAIGETCLITFAGSTSAVRSRPVFSPDCLASGPGWGTLFGPSRNRPSSWSGRRGNAPPLMPGRDWWLAHPITDVVA